MLYQEEAKEITEIIRELTKDYNKIVEYSSLLYCPEIVYIHIDALDKKDYPHRIGRNSIFMDFSINFLTKEVEYILCGHVYLSESDRVKPEYEYLCMRTMTSLGIEHGIKKFRKTKLRDNNSIAILISNYFNAVMREVDSYKGGYPYK